MGYELMAEYMEEPGPTVPFDQHPLYQVAMDDLAAGDEATAVAKLKLLAALYPQEQTLQDLAVRVDLKMALEVSSAEATSKERSSVPRGQPRQGLRNLLLLFLILAAGLVGIAGFIIGYDLMVRPVREARETEIAIESVRQTGQLRLEAGDWAGARESFEALLNVVPGDPTAQAGIDFSLRREALDSQWANALAAEQAGDYQGALQVLGAIQSQEPGYPGSAERIAELQDRVAVEANLQEAQELVQAGDWLGVIAALTRVRNQDPEFRKAEVEDQLYQAYLQVALPQLDQANGNVDQIRQAIEYLDRALALRPTDDQYGEERRLADRFVTGAEAFANQDWEAAVVAWEPVYEARPDYQGGVLRDNLRQAYPQAARQLIARASGSVGLLKQAIRYLAQAAALDPDNTELAEERRLAIEFVAGAEAFAKEDWLAAVAHWGPIYQLRSDYQEGVLRTQLREACAKSTAPDPTFCKP
jgi:tetratricopeptide (TPR) repeat protein